MSSRRGKTDPVHTTTAMGRPSDAKCDVVKSSSVLDIKACTQIGARLRNALPSCSLVHSASIRKVLWRVPIVCTGGIRIAIGYTLRAYLRARTKEKLA